MSPSTRDFLSISTISIFVARHDKAVYRFRTWPIAITHKSGGTFGSAQWMQALTVYKAKWP
jgi:hypothetical protein